MSTSTPKHLVVFFSVGGATGKIAEWINDFLTAAGQQVSMLDLTYADQAGNSPDSSQGQVDCLWVLSPIYVQHPAPAIVEYLQNLPRAEDCLAVPIVTYGIVCSGAGLFEMGSLLAAKGYSLAGAAKVVAEHSMMWAYDEPLGKGRPDLNDKQQILDMAGRVLSYWEGPGNYQFPALEALNYQPEEIRQIAAQRSLDMLRDMFPPMVLDPDQCDECGLCAEKCFTRSITLNPKPEFGEGCVYCLNCIRVCPQKAIDNMALGALESELPKRAESFGEPPNTVVF